MKKIIFYIGCILAIGNVSAQETISPAAAQKETIALTNATIHVGNGQVINNGTVVFKNGKIVWRQSGVIPANQLEKILQPYL